jgi:hypothetical protein
VAGFCECDNEPSGSIKKVGYSLKSRVTITFSKNILHHGVSNVEENGNNASPCFRQL